jgi:hypothetical protein
MASLTITFERHDNLANFDALFSEVALGEVAALVETGTGMAQERAPIDRGFYRSSITNEVLETAPGVITGQIFSTAQPVVVETIENGRAPGRFPPIDVISAWVGRKLAVTDLKSRRSVAFLVARKIALQGIPGKFVFRNTLQAMQPLIQRTGETVASKVASKI